MAADGAVPIEGIAAKVLQGDRRALSRAISWIEDRSIEGRVLLDRLFVADARAHRVGITGPPGSGKSTLTSQLTQVLRERGARVGILAVDPSSPFTGGAILGDRIRMLAHHGDPGVYIRSMASRGSLGGLASTTYEASEAIEAAGFDWILIETVGVGQSEMEVVQVADTTVVVLVPESGDAVQMMKAGLMEAGDLFVINKYDREGGDRLFRELTLMLDLSRDRAGADPTSAGWTRTICRTVATRGDGTTELLDQIDAHRRHLRSDAGRWKDRQARRMDQRLKSLLRDRLLHDLERSGEIDRWVSESRRRILGGEASPYGIVDESVARLLQGGAGFHESARREGVKR